MYNHFRRLKNSEAYIFFLVQIVAKLTSTDYVKWGTTDFENEAPHV